MTDKIRITLEALKGAREWLEGWHSAEKYIDRLDRAIAALEQPEEAAAMRWTHEQLHAAFETQIKHVSHVHYDSNEICRHFYGEFIRELLTPTTPKD